MALLSLPAHILFITLVALIPPASAAAFRELRRITDLGEAERTALYRQLIGTQWVLAAVAVGAAALVAAGEVGRWIMPPEPVSAGSLIFVFGTAAGIVALGVHERRRRDLPELLRDLAVLLPRSGRERDGWAGVSVTAGVCEEIVYRGFLFLYLSAVWPGLEGTALVGVAALIFGAAHLYQGPAGFVATSAIGFVLGAVYLLTGSLWLPILLHALADLRVLWIGFPGKSDARE